MIPLQVSEIRYRRLFESARDGILILNVDTLKIVDANPYIEELLGYEKDELLGKELWEIGILKDKAESQRIYRTLQEHGFLRYDDLPLKAKDGQPRDVEFVSNVYQEDVDSVIQCNIRDISERRLLEKQRETLLAQTETAQLLGRMSQGIALDLAQSLSLVSGYSDLAMVALADSTLDRIALRAMFEVMEKAAIDSGQFVTRLLTFSRAQAVGPAEDVPLPALLAQVGQLTASRWRNADRLEGRSITLSVDAEPNTVIVGWPASLREALVNLVFNAIDALPEGGTILLRAHRRGPKIAVEVQDSGTGMSAAVRSQIFQPFFTTRGVQGTGLGLAQVLSTVEQHNGQISINSMPGQGTTFCLLFPAAFADTVASTSPHAGSLTILVVDDEPLMAELLEKLLRLVGHTVVVVHSADDALQRLSTASFDVVMSDMGMPSSPSWVLTNQIRSRHSATPIIIVSAWGSQITPEEARDRGIHAVVPKPYRLTDLQKAIVSLDPSTPLPGVIHHADPVNGVL